MHPARSHAMRGSGDAEGANSIVVFNLGNEKDVLPSLPSQNAAHADFMTDFTVRLCLQESGERGGRADYYAYRYIFYPLSKGALFILLWLKKRVRH